MKSIKTQEELSEFTKGEEIVMIKFGATWCPPCRAMVPALDRLEASGRKVAEVDVDEAQELSTSFGINGVPVSIFFQSGKEIKRVIGLRKFEDLNAMFQS